MSIEGPNTVGEAREMWKIIMKGFAFWAIAVGAVGVAFVVGMRAKSTVVRNAVRKLSRATRGPAMKSAGTPGAYASIVEHVGRASGRAYRTPVRAAATDDGFVITLPYGPDTDWVKNVLAGGTATIVNEGRVTDVVKPEIVDGSTARRFFLAKDQRTQQLFGVDEYLRVRRAEPAALAG